jgi:hypothetical protein
LDIASHPHSAGTARAHACLPLELWSQRFDQFAAGETFACELTGGAFPGGTRWTLVAVGKTCFHRGIVCVGSTAGVPASGKNPSEPVRLDVAIALRNAAALSPSRVAGSA